MLDILVKMPPFSTASRLSSSSLIARGFVAKIKNYKRKLGR